MPNRNLIPGINRTALWSAWKAVRKQVRHLPYRDPTDFLEYDIDPDVWINRLLKRVNTGTYEPETSYRYEIAKSRGFSRQLTLPQIPDLVLYRAIADAIYVHARDQQHEHVYFAQATLSRVVREAEFLARSGAAPDYESTPSAFLKWLEYDQYRKHLLLDKVYPYIVVSDVTNFFDSVLYSQIEQRLFGLDVPPSMVGLLFFMLERLSLRDHYTQSPRIGLPVDSFDCSRNLAHIVLFPHDDRMVERVGESAYVRWMDDQNIGVNSKAEGLGVLAALGKSLARIHLTANASKSQVLSLKEARVHFHFATNRKLDKASELPVKTQRNRRTLKLVLGKLWKTAKRTEGRGNWDKILKRFYRLAAIAGHRKLRSRAMGDILTYPSLVGRVSDYMRLTGTPREYCQFVTKLSSHKEQVYGDVNVTLIESLLKVEPGVREATRLRSLAVELIRGTSDLNGGKDAAALAPLLILRFGDRRTAKVLHSYLQKDMESQSTLVTKASGLVYASYGGVAVQAVRKVASRLMRNVLGDIVRMIEKVSEFPKVPGRFKNRLRSGREPFTGRDTIDMRTILTARLLSLNSKPSVQRWLNGWRTNLLKGRLSRFDVKLVKRLL